MRKLLVFIGILISVFAKSQTPSTIYKVPSLSNLSTYFGNADRLYVVSVNQDYVTCNPCLTDSVAGAGGRKWKKLVNVSAPMTQTIGYIGADTGRNISQLATGGSLNKVGDSLQANINSKASTASVALKVNISDTAAMLSPYLRSVVAAATYQPIGSYATTTQLGTKLDTSAAKYTYLSLVGVKNDALIRSQQTTGLPPVATLPSVVTVAFGTAYNAWPSVIKDKIGRMQVFYSSGSSHTSNDHVLKQAISGNGGISWTTRTITTPTVNTKDVQALLLSNGNIAMIIRATDAAGSNAQVYFLTSSDNGLTFTTSLLANTYASNGGPIPGGFMEDNGILYASLYGNIGVSDTRPSAVVTKSTDMGATWQSQVTIATAPSSIQYAEPRIVRYNDSLIAFIRDESNKLWRSGSISGATWSPLVNVTPTGYVASEPDPIVVGNMVQLFYRSTTAMSRAASYDGGLTWNASEIVESSGAGNGYEYSKTIFDNGLLITAYGIDTLALTNSKVKILTYRYTATVGLNGLDISSKSYTDTLGIGTFTPTNKVEIVAGTITDQKNAVRITGTMPTVMTGTTNAVDWQVTSAGSSAQVSRAFNINFLAGYTGSSGTQAFSVTNSVAGTGTTILQGSRNLGLQLTTNATTTGTNIAALNDAANGNVNVGVLGRASTAKNSATNIGVIGIGYNTGSSPIQVGGYFGLNDPSAGNPTFTSAALIADNAAIASNIFTARDNGTTVFSIIDGGNTGIGDASPASMLTVGSGDLFQVNSSGNIVKLNNVTTSFPSSNSAGDLRNDGSGNLTWGTAVTTTSGTYTPTLTGVTNITSSTPANCQYTKVGNIVTVFGNLAVVTTLAVTSEIDVSLPVASNFAATTDANGLGTPNSSIAQNIYIDGDATNDRVRVNFLGLSVGGSGNIFFSFSYTVL